MHVSLQIAMVQLQSTEGLLPKLRPATTVSTGGKTLRTSISTTMTRRSLTAALRPLKTTVELQIMILCRGAIPKIKTFAGGIVMYQVVEVRWRLTFYVHLVRFIFKYLKVFRKENA